MGKLVPTVSKRQLRLAVSVLFLLLTVLIMTGCNAAQDKASAGAKDIVVAEVNGEGITEAEMDYFSKRLRAELIVEYADSYGAEYSEDFWTRTFGDGGTPQAELEERAMAECVKAKIQLVLMRERGIYDDITFSGLRQRAEDYNAANESKQKVVGIRSIDMGQFYTYYIDTGVMQLKNLMAEDELKPMQEEMALEIAALADGGVVSGDEETLQELAKSRIVKRKYEQYIGRLTDEARVVSY